MAIIPNDFTDPEADEFILSLLPAAARVNLREAKEIDRLREIILRAKKPLVDVAQVPCPEPVAKAIVEALMILIEATSPVRPGDHTP